MTIKCTEHKYIQIIGNRAAWCHTTDNSHIYYKSWLKTNKQPVNKSTCIVRVLKVVNKTSWYTPPGHVSEHVSKHNEQLINHIISSLKLICKSRLYLNTF